MSVRLTKTTGTRYPWRAVCDGCGWSSWGYVAEHAARDMAHAHRCDMSVAFEHAASGAAPIRFEHAYAGDGCLRVTGYPSRQVDGFPDVARSASFGQCLAESCADIARELGYVAYADTLAASCECGGDE